jgi:tetratricopeptide (TPR) repeat protein
MLWLVHPLQGESVAYIVQRAESLAGLFFLLVLYSVVRARQSSHRVWWYVLAVVSCWLGVATKEIVASAPLVVLLYDRAFWGGSFREALRRRWGVYLGMVASWVPLAGLVACTYFRRGDLLDPWSYASNQPGAILFYLRLAFWPVGLCHEYSLPPAETLVAILPATCVVGLLVAATLWGLVKGRGWGVVGASFFLILAPSSSIVPLVQLACDRRMYLPLAAVVTLVVLGGHALGQRLAGRGRQRGSLAVGVCVVAMLAVALGILAFRHNEIYRDQVSLWRNIVAHGCNSAWADHGLGDALSKQGQTAEATDYYQQAIDYYQQALKSKPNNTETHANLGSVLESVGRLPEAIKHYERAIQLDPDDAVSHNDLGLALAHTGRMSEAIEQYEQAIRLKPDYAEAHTDLGLALTIAGRPPEAIEQHRKAIQLQPEDAVAHNNLGLVLASSGQRDEAIEQFRLGTRYDPESAEIHQNLAIVLAMSNQLPEAVKEGELAVRLKPDYREAYQHLIAVLVRIGHIREALEHGKKAVTIVPDDPQCQQQVAWLMATHEPAEGDDAVRAVELAEQACTLTGHRDAVCVDTLAAAYASAGRFDEAVVMAKEAWRMAEDAGEDALAEEIHIRLQLYRDRKPYREPTAKRNTEEQ